MEGSRRPAPFIVGAPRSGTTLLRLMLDAHPDMAIPAETGIFLTLAAAAENEGLPATADQLWAMLTGHFTWRDTGLDAAEFRSKLAAQGKFSLGEGLRSFFQMYAARHGKTRWGEKSPLHCHHLALIQETLPEAHILHLIRDGRAVAASLREVWFSPSDDAAELAAYWAGAVQAGRSGGKHCRHYMELRYEALVQQPRESLQDVCDFLELPFHQAMLNYHQNALARLSEAHGRVLDDGTVITLEQRLEQQRLTSSPPDVSRLGRWRDELSAEDVAVFEATAGELLMELGYSLVYGPSGSVEQ